MSLYDKLWNGNPNRAKDEKALEQPSVLVRFERLILGRLIQLIELNVVTVLLCIPIITIPAAFSGMSRVLMLYWREIPVISLWKEYFSAFKEFFFEKLLVWLITFLAPVSLPLFCLFLGQKEAAIILSFFFGILSFLLLSYWFPLCAILSLSPLQNMKNALLLMAKEWKYSLWMLLLVALPYCVCAFFIDRTFPFWCLCIFALGQLIQCCFTSSAIDKNKLIQQ